MNIVNWILIIVGLFTSIIGILAFFNPVFARIINAPGGPRLKGIIALIAGLILIVAGYLIEIPME